MRSARGIGVVCLLALAAGPGWAELTKDEETRLKKLEKEMEELKAKGAKDEKNGTPLKVFYKDGIKFKSDDEDFDLSIGGRVIENGRFFTQTSPNDNTFYNRDTQIQLKGKLFGQFRYDLSSSLSGTSSTLNNSYVEYERDDHFAIRVGQFKEPFLVEQTTSTLWRDFPERSVADRLAPGRDIGVQIAGKFFQKRLGYELGYFNGAGRNANDGNDDKDWAGRLTLAPWVAQKEHALNKLQMWVMGTWGRQDSVAPTSFSATDTGTTFLTFNTATLNSENKTRKGIGSSWAMGRAKFIGEFASMNMDLKKVPQTGPLGLDNENLNTRFDAWYLTAGWMLTGEDAVVGGRVTPKKPFGKKGGGYGAWELVARLSGFQAEREPFYNLDKQYASAPQPTSTGVGSTTNVDSWQAGINWTPISNARVMLSYGENDFGADYVGTLGADTRKRERYVMLSTQFDF